MYSTLFLNTKFGASYFRFIFQSIFNDCPSSIIVFLPFPYDTQILLVVFLALNCRINFTWRHGLNLLMWRNWIILLQLWLGIRLWLMNLAVFCHHITSRINRRIFLLFSCSIKWGITGTCFLGGGGVVFHYELYFDDPMFPFHMHCTKKRLVQFYHSDIIYVHYIVQINMWSLLLYKIIVGFTCCFPIITTAFYIFFNRVV